ncbi:CoA transferase subunit A [Algihabitans albus]|uniref:CoA transferase subunit A n=1 Tax=Algihabitans albus TaxID=2164067 RepID=UPI000E5D64CB|nr:CoA transferase [Algihabitans albus]
MYETQHRLPGGAAQVVGLDHLISEIEDGCRLALPPDYGGVAVAATLRIIERAPRSLHLICLPSSGLQADMLIASGCVGTVETAAITLGEAGLAPAFTQAVKAGRLRMLDATCPALHAGFQAAEKGVPFMPLRGIIGSDILHRRLDWQVIDNPFPETDADLRIVTVPAIRPDVALFHAPRADRSGNVWIGRRRELASLAHAARRTLVTVEEIVDDDLLAEEASAAGVLPSLYVSSLAVAPGGARPLGLQDLYEPEPETVANWTQAGGQGDWAGAFAALRRALAGETAA